MHRKIKLSSLYHVLILVLSLYVVGEVTLEVISDWSETTLEVLEYIDFAICVLFLGDWAFFFVRSTNRKRYFRNHLVDLVSSIPFVQILRPLRIARAVRIFRALRLMRGLKGVLPIMRWALKTRRRSALSGYMACTSILYFYCVVGLLNFEKGHNEKVASFGDALWLGFTTLTTIGYGDAYPVTTGGRVMMGILAVVGLGLFSLVTAEIASLLVEPAKGEGKKAAPNGEIQ